MRKGFLALTSLLLVSGCAVWPLRPGRASFRSESGAVAQVRQSQNPQAETTQTYERISEPVTNGTPIRVTERSETHIGAAQKDTARELGAKLSSLRGIVWVGVLVFLFGVASAFYPPLKLLVGSVTTSAVLAVAGIALIILPSLIVGNELLILGVAGGAAVLWFLAHRHGKASGVIETLTKKV